MQKDPGEALFICSSPPGSPFFYQAFSFCLLRRITFQIRRDGNRQSVQIRHVLFPQGGSHDNALVQDLHVLHSFQELPHQSAGPDGPGAVLHDGYGPVLHVEGLHVHEEIVHGREDAEIVGHAGQHQVAVSEDIRDQIKQPESLPELQVCFNCIFRFGRCKFSILHRFILPPAPAEALCDFPLLSLPFFLFRLAIPALSLLQ